MSHYKHRDRPKSDRQILSEQMDESLQEYNRNNRSLLLSSIGAGMEIGFSVFLIAAFYSHLHAGISHQLMYLLAAMSYPVGFMLVVIGMLDVLQFLAIATAGNIIGGSVFVGRVKYSSIRNSH
ncbi:formate/nitrite transporter family protein [Microbulbifer sp. HZ11]|uniref:formate/nitrite transporter family protein n=1 Tax=Microbulbifer sp. HZ11 TaxID=1453501 RepID=UPI00068C2F9D|nr:formate/nitrite transporter family protein [Microbulbifer sp. HZ11]